MGRGGPWVLPAAARRRTACLAGGRPSRLERAAVRPEVAEAPLEQAALRGHGEAVLLAQDDPTVLGVWTSHLRRHGYLVTAVEDGAAAVQAVRAAARPFELALLDVTRPRMGGPEALRRIRGPQSHGAGAPPPGGECAGPPAH